MGRQRICEENGPHTRFTCDILVNRHVNDEHHVRLYREKQRITDKFCDLYEFLRKEKLFLKILRKIFDKYMKEQVLDFKILDFNIKIYYRC